MAPPGEPATQQSPWQSPVPYLFGGLAAMLGLIALALLILACSYWKLSGNHQDDEEMREDLEADGGARTEQPVAEAKYLVIMAGQEKPTFLATPMSSRASSFGSKSSVSCGCSTSESSTLPLEEDYEEKGVESGRNVHIQLGNI